MDKSSYIIYVYVLCHRNAVTYATFAAGEVLLVAMTVVTLAINYPRVSYYLTTDLF